MSRRNHSMARDIVLLTSGIGIGTGIALLLAPATGEDMRHALAKGCRKTAKTIGRRTEELRDRAEDLLDHAHELTDKGSRLLRSARQWQQRRFA